MGFDDEIPTGVTPPQAYTYGTPAAPPAAPGGPGVPWYFQTWCIVLAFLLFGPLGFILLWMSPAVSKRGKTITTVAILVAGVLLFCGVTAAMMGLAAAVGDKYESSGTPNLGADVYEPGTSGNAGTVSVTAHLAKFGYDSKGRVTSLTDTNGQEYAPAEDATYSVDGEAVTAAAAGQFLSDHADAGDAVYADIAGPASGYSSADFTLGE